ncbi:MAG: YSC84-related protein [Paracoccaceae bacterium]
MTLFRRPTAILLALAGLVLAAPAARAADAAVIDTRVDLALSRLFVERPGTAELAERAVGILVIPRIVKGGFILGGRYGEGALRLGVGPDAPLGRTVAYYALGGASVGLQVGVQESSQALFFLDRGTLERFRRSNGWTAGVDAEVTLLDRGASLGTSSRVAEQPVIAFVFGQDGLLAGASVEGAKYSRIKR